MSPVPEYLWTFWSIWTWFTRTKLTLTNYICTYTTSTFLDQQTLTQVDNKERLNRQEHVTCEYKAWQYKVVKICCRLTKTLSFRDRPFNLKGGEGLWFFVSFRNFFSDNTRVRIFFFLSRKARIFFQNGTVVYMTKTLNQIIFFILHQNQNIFFSNIGNQNIFLEKNHNPPLSS